MRLMDELKINQVELARLADASKSMVNQWLSGRIKSIGSEYAFNLQRHTGFNAEWLMTGNGPERPTTAMGVFKQSGAAFVQDAVALYDASTHEKGHSDWPFSTALLDRIKSLSSYDQGIIEGRLRAALDELENEHKQLTKSANGKP